MSYFSPHKELLLYTPFEVPSMRHFSRIFFGLLLSLCLSLYPSFAFETNLSDEAVREAYFLGQRHDEKISFFFETYRHYLPAPKSGPHVFMAELLTPFGNSGGFSKKRTRLQRPAGSIGLPQPRRFCAVGSPCCLHCHLWTRLPLLPQ